MSEARQGMKRRSFLGGLLAALTLGRIPRQVGPSCFVPWNPEIAWEDFLWPGGMEGPPTRMARVGPRIASIRAMAGLSTGVRSWYDVVEVEIAQPDEHGVVSFTHHPIESGSCPTHDLARRLAERALRS